MAATEYKNIWLHSTADGVAPQIKTYKIAASQGVFMPGAPCYLSTSGTIKLSDTCDGTGDVYHGFIVGLANKSTTWPIAAQLAGNTEVRVSMIDPDDYYVVQVETSGTDATAPQTLVGDSNGLVVSTTATQIGYTTLNTANSNTAFLITDLMANVEPSKYALADSPGWVIGKFLSANVNVSKA